jgi:GNAT superfamily N-acetyltransferase
MTATIGDLHEVRAEDVPQAGAMLAAAFEPDPIWSEVFAGVPIERMAVWFRGPMLYCRTFGRAYATSDRFEGAAGIVPGEFAVMNMRRAMRAGTWKMGFSMGPQLMMRAPRMMRVFAPLDADRQEHMGDRAFDYLMIVGVAPEHQHKGHGGTLIRALIEDSDRTGVPIYLETETEGNQRMYEHFGFETLRQIELPVVGLPMWEMLREPVVADGRSR